MKLKLVALAAIAAAPFAYADDQDVYITEFSYKGLFGEYIEVTNTGEDDVDLDGWRYDDNSQNPNAVVLFNEETILGQNDTIIITEVSEAVFKQAWYTDAGLSDPAGLVAIYQNNSVNLGRNDEINIYNASSVLVDRLTFNDEGSGNVDGPRTEDISAKPGPLTVLGDNIFANWVLSGTGEGGTPNGNAWKAGDPSATGPIGSPGVYPN